MFASIRRHQKWLWILISAAVIVSFVVFFTPDVESHFRGGGGGDRAYGVINGRSISREEAQRAFMEARLRYFLFSGTQRWPEDDPASRNFFNQDRETQTRLFLIEKIKEMKVEASQEARVEWIRTAFRDTTGVFRKESFDQFMQNTLQPRGYTLADLFRFAGHEVALQHLASVVGIPGFLVTPREAERKYREEHEQVTAAGVFFSYSNYVAAVTLDPAAIAQFYTNQMSRYRIPEQRVASYVRFDATNYLAEADQMLAGETNLAANIEAVYQQRGTNYYVDATNQPLPADAARQRIREEIRHAQALFVARKTANEFTDEVFELLEKQPKMSEHLDRLAAAKGYPVHVTEPFDFDGPSDASLPPAFTRAGLSVTVDEPVAMPVVGTNAVYVLALKSTIPSEIPPLAAIQDRVTEDYRRSQAIEMARITGGNFYSTITNGLAAGKTLETIGTEAHVPIVKLPTFALSATSVPEIERHVSLSQFRDAIERVGAGKSSSFIRTPEGGFIAYVQSRQAVSDEEVKRDLAEYTARLREERQFNAFNEWFRKEREKSGFQVEAAAGSGS